MIADKLLTEIARDPTGSCTAFALTNSLSDGRLDDGNEPIPTAEFRANEIAVLTKRPAQCRDLDLQVALGDRDAWADAVEELALVVPVVISATVDVAGIRKKLGFSQEVFAMRFGFSVKNIRNWEQGVRQPGGPARAYLLVIDRKPEAVQEALSAA